MSTAAQAPDAGPAERAAELRRQLDYHGYRYYVLDDPEIGDVTHQEQRACRFVVLEQRQHA